MTKKPRIGDLKKRKKYHEGCMPLYPVETYAFDAHLGKRSVFIEIRA